MEQKYMKWKNLTHVLLEYQKFKNWETDLY